MAIEPDTKDWTWVLERPCPECGTDVASLDVTQTGALARQVAADLADALLASPAPAQRPDASTWSPLEYACHVRDVFVLFDERLALMLSAEAPAFANWDQDASAGAYGASDPALVAASLRTAVEPVAARFDGVSGAQWQRTGHRSDGATFTVESFARYFLHDPLHHLWDVRRLHSGPAAT